MRGARFFFVAGAVGARFFLLRVRSVFAVSLYFTMKTFIFSVFSDFFSLFHEEDMREEYMKS